ncbi:MAG TPA: M48 family metalloprotease, partial [Gammaproteobacteria bacterium]|nr:M48 family metalloprotease [Gammaproteobacteria bacterium]
AYLQDLGQRLATRSTAPELDYHFFILDIPSINAFAMPGGYIGVNAGLILAARSESELAGVLAHEIAHVTQRHLARRLESSQRVTLQNAALLLAALLIGSQDPQAGTAAAAASVAGSIQQQLNYSRAFEHEADNLGIRMLAAADLDPHGMPAFFGRLAEATRYQNRPPEYLSTHPVTESRISESSSRASSLGGGKIFESDTFRFMQYRLRVLKANPVRVEDFETLTRHASRTEQPAARYGLALAHAANRDYTKARSLLESLIDETGEQPSLLLALARLERDAGRLPRSFELYEQVLALYPGNQPARLGYAEALLQANDPNKAYWVLSRALPSSDASTYWLLAKAAAAAGRGNEPQLAMAEYYGLRGDYDAALLQLQQVLNNPAASPHDTARASARREQLQRERERLLRQ